MSATMLDIINNVKVDQRINDFKVIKRHIGDLHNNSYSEEQLSNVLGCMGLEMPCLESIEEQRTEQDEDKQNYSQFYTFFVSYDIEDQIYIKVHYLVDKCGHFYIHNIDISDLDK